MPFISLPASLACKITFSSSKKIKNNSVSVVFSDGYEQVVDIGLNSSYDIWELEFAPLNETLKGTMDTFITTVKTSTTFTWTPPGEVSEKKWRVVKDSYSETRLANVQYRVTFSIKQSFEN